MANKTVTSCSNKKGVRKANKLLAKSRWMMHVIYVREHTECHVQLLWRTWVWNDFKFEDQELLTWDSNLRDQSWGRENNPLEPWKCQNEGFFPLINSIPTLVHPYWTSFLSSYPEDTVRVIMSFSGTFSFPSFKEGFCSAFSIASSWARWHFVSNMVCCFSLNP